MSDDDSLTLARQIAAQAWCADANAHKIMDVDLCDAFAHLMAAELDRLRAELAGTQKLVRSMTAENYEAAARFRATIDELQTELARVTGERDRFRDELRNIVRADWREWGDDSSAQDFVAWAKARASWALAKAPPA